MKELRPVLLTLVCIAAFLCLWPVLHRGQISANSQTTVDCVFAFCLSALILGKWLLNNRFSNPEPGSFDGFAEIGVNGLLWIGGLAVCALTLFFHSWLVVGAAVIGMIAGSFVWPSQANDNTAQFPLVEQKPSADDVNPAIPSNTPDFTQDTGHPGE